jgi:peptidyl-prolyl cis-trans isomerase SurA
LIKMTVSKIQHIYLGLLVLILLHGMPVNASAQTQGEEEGPKVLDEIVAKVNDEIITLTDLQEALSRLKMDIDQNIKDPSQRDEQYGRMKESLLGTMITNKIIVQKAEELGVSDDIDQDVDMYIENVRKESGVPSLDVIDEYFKQRGSSLTLYKRSIREQMVIRSMINQFVYSKITLLTPEVEAYYKEHQDDFTEKGKVKLAEILFLTEGKDMAEVKKQAESVLEQLKTTPFENLAKEYSDGPTAAQGGEIGEFQQGSVNEVLANVVFSIEVGTYSDIIEAEFGFQIVKVLERTPPVLKSLRDVRPSITEALYNEKSGPELEEYTNQLITESYIHVNPKYTEEYDLTGLI